MKEKFKYLLMAVLVTVGFTSCNNDNDVEDNGGQLVKGKETYAQLRIVQDSPATYGTTAEEAPITAVETDLATTLAVYIFDENGILEYVNSSLNVTSQITDAFKITSGFKYFYVFSNNPAITDPVAGTHRTAFEQQVKDVTFASNNTSITQNNQFFIGTLWGKLTEVKGDKPAGTTETISLQIGRVGAKVALTEVKNDARGNLKGDFDNNAAEYRLRATPKKYYLVGQYSVAMPPADGAVVVSAVHNEGPSDPAPGAGPKDPNPVFVDYTWANATNIGGANQKYYYAIENTTAKHATTNEIYFGNTSYLQLKVKYTPDPAELRDAVTGDYNATPAGDGTFYTATVNGDLFMFNENPQIAGATNPLKYDKGINYYNIPIKDQSESGIVQQCKVLRNHYYNMVVNSISRLGENTDYVDPWTPIKEEKDVNISVSILQWSKISQIEDL